MRIKFVFILIIIMSLFLCPLIVGADETLFAQKRKQMVENQIKARGIKDLRVLEAMLKVKRHLFVPSEIRHLAYEDRPLPIGGGQTISQPYIVALMTELLALKGTERVLEIGTGSGYQAAILAQLAKEVYTIERLGPLARQSEYKKNVLVCQWNNGRKESGLWLLKEPEPEEALMAEEIQE